MSDPDRYVREAECYRITGLSRTTRWRMERRGTFPARRQLGDNSVGWLLSDVVAWRDARVAIAQEAVVRS